MQFGTYAFHEKRFFLFLRHWSKNFKNYIWISTKSFEIWFHSTLVHFSASLPLFTYSLLFLGNCRTKDHFSPSLRSNLGIIYLPQWYKLKKSRRIENLEKIYEGYYQVYVLTSFLTAHLKWLGVKSNKLQLK